MKNKIQDNKGFTLIELLIVGLIGLVLAAVIVAADIASHRNFVTGMAALDIHDDARLAMDYIVRDLRWTHEIESSSVTIGSDTYATGDSELVLNIPSIDGSGNIIIGNFDNVVYFVDPGNSEVLWRRIKVNAGNRIAEFHVVANNLSSITFSSGGTTLSGISNLEDISLLTVQIQTSKTVLGTRTVTEDIETQTWLRNYE